MEALIPIGIIILIAAALFGGNATHELNEERENHQTTWAAAVLAARRAPLYDVDPDLAELVREIRHHATVADAVWLVTGDDTYEYSNLDFETQGHVDDRLSELRDIPYARLD